MIVVVGSLLLSVPSPVVVKSPFIFWPKHFSSLLDFLSTYLFYVCAVKCFILVGGLQRIMSLCHDIFYSAEKTINCYSTVPPLIVSLAR